MKSKLIKVICAGSLVSLVYAQEEQQLEVSRNVAVDTAVLNWDGEVQRTYFIESSEDLVNWQYHTTIDVGNGNPLEQTLTASAESSFFRLRFSDVFVENAELADFDFDGIPSIEEIQTLGTDPFLADTDGDGNHDGSLDLDGNGLGDGWEIAHFGSTGQDPSANPDGDNLNNLEEFQNRLNPNQFTFPGEANNGHLGTFIDDNFGGTPQGDVLSGGPGNDFISGLGDNDVILGGFGDDFLQGDEGDDEIRGDEGDDQLDGGPGDDLLIGGAGNDVLEGGAGNDRYLWNLGDGDDVVFDFDGLNTIVFGGDIISSDATFIRVNGNDFFVEDENGESLRIEITDSATGEVSGSVVNFGFFREGFNIEFSDGEVIEGTSILTP